MSFANVNINDKNHFLVRLNWFENTCDIQIFDYKELVIREGKVNNETNQEMAAKYSISMNDYKTEIGKALSDQPSTAYSCTLRDNTLNIKKAESLGIFSKLLVVNLNEVPIASSLPYFMESVAQTLTESSHQVTAKDEEITKLAAERDQLKNKCMEYAKIVEDLTPYLMAQFKSAFNSLKNRLEAVRDEAPSTSRHKSTAESKKKFSMSPTASTPRKRQNTDDGSSSDYGEVTDVDTEDE